jgi:hypothetical protein
VITDIAVERVEFRCPESHWQSVADYDVVTYADTDGAEFEFYSKDGVPTLSPYTIDGAPLCPVCHRAVVGAPVARRLIPVPPGDDGRPRQPMSDVETRRAQRWDMPLLSGTPARSGEEISRPARAGAGTATGPQPDAP